MIASVIVDILSSNVDRVFDYLIPENLEVSKGHRVTVPFGGRVVEGYVIDIKENSELPLNKLKGILRVLDENPSITAEMLELMYYMQGKYHILLADALRLFIPSELRGERVSVKTETFVYIREETDIDKILSDLPKNARAQAEILRFFKDNAFAPRAALNKLFSPAALKKLTDTGILLLREEQVDRKPYLSIEPCGERVSLTYNQKAAVGIIEKNSPDTFLLFGVTGSGKTEIYLNRIEKAVADGKTAIMLVPEIALTPQIMRIFRQRLGEGVALLHSGLSAGERLDEWNRLRCGAAKIAVGARSAIFAPLENIGVIIIDEEHEQSYISESSPRYDTREIAGFRAKYNNCSLVMGSATPLVESFYKAQKGKYRLIELTERINGRQMPEITLVDMRREVRAGNNTIFSSLLKDKIAQVLSEKKQAILFINRRGYSPVVICSDCGYTAKCSNCDVTLNYHMAEEVLKCHYCGGKYEMLSQCPSCGSGNLRKSGAGTQKVCDELKKLFPSARLLRMDNDTTQSKEAHVKILEKFGAKQADLLVGTQMIAKGHDFPSVTLVGVLDADLSLYFTDYRSVERTFSLITQVAGRAGRADDPGEVIVQTHTPQHYVYKMICEYDYRGFYKREISLREAAKYPPFARVLRIMVISELEDEAKAALKSIYEKAKAIKENNPESFIFLNAMKCPVHRIKNKYRYQVLSRVTGNIEEITGFFYDIVDITRMKNITSYLEINPSSMY